MKKDKLPAPPPPPTVVAPPGAQQAHFAIRIGERAGLSADVTVTSAGLLAIGGLVSAILLSTAVLVRAAKAPV
jgi:hypothetical protein